MSVLDLSGKRALVAGGGQGIGRATALLVSDLAKKITGQVIVVDGGFTTRFPYGLQ